MSFNDTYVFREKLKNIMVLYLYLNSVFLFAIPTYINYEFINITFLVHSWNIFKNLIILFEHSHAQLVIIIITYKYIVQNICSIVVIIYKWVAINIELFVFHSSYTIYYLQWSYYIHMYVKYCKFYICYT